ncbi:hypothetical protein ALNOE001_20360 [Candidatus Methanobinarius endosymbioticus]|uniref:Uncharacterized protein n=1 Tax=Candidatus Methanobinarius endosymbioticus TaxID=2006182 RepID=A0A366M7Y1_9EURY|nr:hypothetical protein ALNOE001_20360 [Candidatus Methanobinarius endosymbioticus]
MRSYINYNVFYKNSEKGYIVSYEKISIGQRIAATEDNANFTHYINTDYYWWCRNV